MHASTSPTGEVTITAAGITVTGSPGGQIAVRDASGKIRLQGSKFQLKDAVAGTLISTGGTPTEVPLPDGTTGIKMVYTMPAAAGPITVTGLVTVSTNAVHYEWTVTGSTTLTLDGFMFSRAIIGGVGSDVWLPINQWNRAPDGGIPFETAAGVAYASTWTGLHGLLILEKSKKAWTNTTWVHAPGTATGPDSAVTGADFIFSEQRPNAAAAAGQGRDLAIELWTEQPFNLWSGPGVQMPVKVQVANALPQSRSAVLTWWARDFNGTILGSSTATVTVPALGTVDYTFSLSSPAYGSIVTEVSVQAGSDSAFARTNLTVLPDYDYQAGDSCIFGIANYPWLQVPSADALLDLWQKVGIRWVRIAYDGGPGVPPAVYDQRGMPHNIELQPPLPLATTTDAAALAWATTSVDTAIAAGARYFEVGNELNRPWNTPGGTAAAYVAKALRPVYEQVQARGATLKLLNNGIAGMDKPWLEEFHAAGGWDLIDGFAFHPGRGNFAPDYIPAGPGEDWDAGATGRYWNFLGGLRQLKALMAQYGPKEIWMTEAYACTQPNAWWHDSYRHAAENVLLTLALALAEGVRCVNWYQFHDSVIGNEQLANEANAEYHFGLMNRDASAKPSLLAYATATRTLDGATFVRWLQLPGASKGLLFDTPRGQAAVLWNRTDGYILNTAGPRDDWRFPEPEVWVDTWATKTNLTVCARTATVKQVDCIGQESTLTRSAGKVTVRLDGAARIFYGLDFDHPLPGGHR
ncbi:hypothetical protein GCM10009554_19190 [Kribbella koreensis]|uniref:Asl1-like glycosyl hydrolase catalytic domain-containing protein n=1 Tax=Kribbella koreensis TaxID=57909 RepID=A0ABN1PW57_9ACTN